MTAVAQHVLAAHFPDLSSRARVSQVGEPGFSGALVFRIDVETDSYCLKQWPLNHPEQRLRELHHLLRHIGSQALSVVPVPLLGVHGQSVVRVDQRLWQLERWMPGIADYWQTPSDERLKSAFMVLAQWHRLAATFAAGCEWFRVEPVVQAPTVSDRVAGLLRYAPDVIEQLEASLLREAHRNWREYGQLITTTLRWRGPRLLSDLQQAATWRVDVQPVIRDVWHDHVLFTGNEVTGLIDYGAARTDTVAADISRLLGSLVGDNSNQRQIALSAYEAVRPLTPTEHQLIPLLDQSNTLLSGLTWLHRRYIEHLPIEQESRVLARLQRIAERLSQWGSPCFI